MAKLNLTKRMKEIAQLVNSQFVADIGCDHGKIIAKLFMENKINFAVLSDISVPSVKKAEKLLHSLNIDKAKYFIRSGNGMQTLSKSDNIQQVIISGMGGYEIQNILENAPFRVSSLILQPQNNWIKLKKYLNSTNYKIVFDKVFYDGGKYYNVIKVEEGIEKIDEFDLRFGKQNFLEKTEDFKKYLFYLKTSYEEILQKGNRENLSNIKEEYNMVEKAIFKLGE